MHDDHRTSSIASRTVDSRVRALSPPVHATAVVRSGPGQAHEAHPGVYPAGQCEGLTGMARQMCHAFL